MMALLPENAPFSPPQRAWLNGFFAGLLGLEQLTSGPASAPSAAPVDEEIDTPWHDPAMPLADRMALADGKPLKWQLMAAMGQLDCGQCGLLCDAYAGEIAAGRESDITKCVPGGKATAKTIKLLLEKTPPAAAAPAQESKTQGLAGIPGQNAVESPASAGVSRDRPVMAKLVAVNKLNVADTDKPVNNIALSLSGTGLVYQPGDSLGVWPTNNPDEVELILSILKTSGAKSIALRGEVGNARNVLTRRVNLREPTSELFKLMSEHARLEFESVRLAKLAENDELVAEYGIHDVFDVLVKFRSARPPIGPFVNALAPLQPRLYSIASSLKAHPDEVHLTVGVVRYDLNGRGYHGVASNFFAEHLAEGRRVPVYIQPSHGFKLPADPNVPVIMVGPGTGIAPFRSFLEERRTTGATGKNWLFFGAQHEAGDFLYRDELEKLATDGTLTRLSTAFSRDQSQKIYVQHRMIEQAADIWTWLAEGAHFYVCGDAKRMAADVDAALKEIVAEQGKMDAMAAAAYVKQLAKDGRYSRDVY